MCGSFCRKQTQVRLIFLFRGELQVQWQRPAGRGVGALELGMGSLVFNALDLLPQTRYLLGC